MSDTQRLTIEAFGRSDAGAVARGSGRPDEDSLCVTKLADGRAYLCAVADGLGVRRGGSVASTQTVRLLQEAATAYARHGGALLRQLPEALASTADYLAFVVNRIDGQLRLNAENNVSISGMASTLTAVYLEGGMAHAVHVGDSRLYRLDTASGELTQITHDDGPPFSDEFDPAPTAAVGALEPSQAPAVASFPVSDGDVLILCTDGLWREVDPPTMRRILLGSPSCALAVDRLLRAANLGGGRGNLAVVVVHAGRPDLVDDEGIDRDFPPPGALLPGRERAGPLPTPRGWQTEPAASPERSVAEVPAAPPSPEAVPAGPSPMPAPEAPEPAPFAAPFQAAPPADADVQPAPETQPPAPEVDLAEAFGPRAAAIASVPPARPTMGPFVIGALCGAAAAVFLCVLLPTAWKWFFPPAGRQPPAHQQPVEAIGDREPVTMPVWAWAKTADNTMRMCSVSYKSYDTATGEWSWQPLDYVRDNQPSRVTMFRDDKGLHLFLDVEYAMDSATKNPYGGIVTVKFRPDEEQRKSVAVVPGRDARPGGAEGVVTVTAYGPGKATLSPMEASQNLLKTHPAVAQLYTTDGREYTTQFTGVPEGTYVVSVGGTSRVARVEPASFRPKVVFGQRP
jgi:protein phosphatase